MDAFQWALGHVATITRIRGSYPAEVLPALDVLEQATLHGAPRSVLDAALQAIGSIQR